MAETKFCELCESKYVVDETGICGNCKGKGLPKSKPEVKVKGRGK